MFIGEQIINPTEDRLRLSTQLGVEHVVIDTRPDKALEGADGNWDANKVAAQRKWIEGFGLKVVCMSLDLGSFVVDTVYQPARAAWRAAKMRADIQAAADGGLEMLKYNLHMVGITRTGRRAGRGGVLESTFVANEYSPDTDKAHSYWGVGHPGGGAAADIAVNAVGTTEALGQVLASDIAGMNEAQVWAGFERFLDEVLPIAEKAGLKLAFHPHDPAYPPGGLNGVEHVLGSVDGLERFLDIAPESPCHGMNFCQGTIAEMSPDPNACVQDAIQRIGARNKIFMVHFRNIKGGFCDFSESFPDDGDVDMLASIRSYRAVGYAGVLCPDHVPSSDLDSARERFFAFALGYTKGLLRAD